MMPLKSSSGWLMVGFGHQHHHFVETYGDPLGGSHPHRLDNLENCRADDNEDKEGLEWKNILSHKDAKFSEHYLQSTQDWRGTCHQSWRTSQHFLSWSRSWRSSRWPFSSAGCSASWGMWSCWCWRRYKCWLTGRCDVRLVASLWAVGWILLELPTQHNVRPGRVTFSWHLPVTFTLSRIHETSLIINQGGGINMQWINHAKKIIRGIWSNLILDCPSSIFYNWDYVYKIFLFLSPSIVFKMKVKWRWGLWEHTPPPPEFCSLYVTEDKATASEAGTCYAQMSRSWWETVTKIRHNITTSLLTLHFTTFKSLSQKIEDFVFHIVLIPFTSDNRWIVESMIFKCLWQFFCHEKVSNVIKSHKMWLPWPASCHGEERSQRGHLWISWHRRHDGDTCVMSVQDYFNYIFICSHLLH